MIAPPIAILPRTVTLYLLPRTSGVCLLGTRPHANDGYTQAYVRTFSRSIHPIPCRGMDDATPQPPSTPPPPCRVRGLADCSGRRIQLGIVHPHLVHPPAPICMYFIHRPPALICTSKKITYSSVQHVEANHRQVQKRDDVPPLGFVRSHSNRSCFCCQAGKAAACRFCI